MTLSLVICGTVILVYALRRSIDDVPICNGVCVGKLFKERNRIILKVKKICGPGVGGHR